MESCCWGPRSSSSQTLPSQPKKPSTSSPGAQFRGGNSRWVSPCWRTPPAHAALPEGGRSPKLRLNSQVLAHTLLLYQLIMGLPFPSDFLCHTRGPSKHPFTPHDTHRLMAAGLGGGLDPVLPAPGQSSKGLGRAGEGHPSISHLSLAEEAACHFSSGFLRKGCFFLPVGRPRRGPFSRRAQNLLAHHPEGQHWPRDWASGKAPITTPSIWLRFQQPVPTRKRSAAIVAHEVTWPKLNSLKAWLRQQFITLWSRRT